jgi:RluA family pseudouridine synthase
MFNESQKLSRKISIVTPYPITHRFKVAKEFEGKSLLEMMATKFPFKPQEEWERRINLGRVYVNEEEVTPGFLLSLKDEIFHHNPRVVEPSVPDEVEVLEEREDYLFVFKPAPMPMHPGGRYNRNTLTELLHDRGFRGLRIVHRLDAVTSGLVLIAQNKEFAKQAMQQFTDGKVKKTYFAHVAGNPEEQTKTIDSPIRRKHGFVFESDSNLTGAREAVTHFEVVEQREGSAIVKCMPETGRTHQIRLHLSTWGYPIIDDPIYGPDGDRSSKTTQKRAISLLNAGLEIEELGISYSITL